MPQCFRLGLTTAAQSWYVGFFILGIRVLLMQPLIWKTKQQPQDQKSFHYNPKERQCQRMFKLQYNCTHFTYQQYSKSFKLGFSRTWTKNFQMYELNLEKAGPEIKLPTSVGSQKKQENSRKIIYFRFIGYAKAFNCVDHNKLQKILKEVEILDHLNCLLRNLNADQEGTELAWNNRLVQNWERNTSKLYVVTLLI